MASSSNSKPQPAEESRKWVELHPDVMGKILHRVGPINILMNAQMVCTTWWRICKDPAMWRSIDMLNLGLVESHGLVTLEMMCMRAVDRSQGQLLNINIGGFGTDHLLDFISHRSSQLRRLQLVCCHGISSKGLSEAVEKLPLLEELHLYHSYYISKEAIVVVGRCCSFLRSLKLNGYMGLQIPCDEIALAIAESMPELRHLQLFGNKMTNDGLQAILDGCPRLESLDVRQCFNICLDGNLGRRCSQQIKDLRRPYDSTQDYQSYDEIINFCESFYMSGCLCSSEGCGCCSEDEYE